MVVFVNGRDWELIAAEELDDENEKERELRDEKEEEDVNTNDISDATEHIDEFEDESVRVVNVTEWVIEAMDILEASIECKDDGGLELEWIDTELSRQSGVWENASVMQQRSLIKLNGGCHSVKLQVLLIISDQEVMENLF